MGLFQRFTRLLTSQVGRLRSTTDEVVDEVKETASDLAEKSRPYVARAKETLENAADRAEDFIDDAVEKAGPTVRKAREKLETLADRAEDAAEDLYDRTRAAVGDFLDADKQAGTPVATAPSPESGAAEAAPEAAPPAEPAQPDEEEAGSTPPKSA